MNIDRAQPWFVRLAEPDGGEGRQTGPSDATVFIEIDGEAVSVPMSSSVAAAMMIAGVRRFGTRPRQQSARAPYCMMGVCFECVVDIDGVSGKQACLTSVKGGMRVYTRGSVTRLTDGSVPTASAMHYKERDDVEQ
jgi:hypothetical protein